ncbi:MAG: imidazoleglycerol-phosphate dehydratase HisB [Methylobacteriaceae bacterium]|nr:imidazoleglycerol-phosphate dehydratase HisB [Methylobacteriaceae bacterium]MCC0002041.1 imidazoleglycerol-phosphate dehydratase HisB [Methylobacteriaceae bacterium]
MRRATVQRKTKETDISLAIALDGSGKSAISTGIGFFDHMLDQIARHGLFDLEIAAKGDLHIDDHHTVEDVGIALGQAIKQALGDRKGIRRYATAHVPMDEALTRVSLDLSGRAFLVFDTQFPTPKIGTFDTELVREFFQALAGNCGANVHVDNIRGANSHHIAESCFKALARALREAVEIDPRQSDAIPSTKGVL